jgi:aconitate hydratase
MPGADHSVSAEAAGARGTLETPSGGVALHRLEWLADRGLASPLRLPHTVKIVLENVLRRSAAGLVSFDEVAALARWPEGSGTDVPFMPARVLMQDFTGVPAVVDLTAMRAAAARMGRDTSIVEPLIPVDLIIDHSVQVDRFGSAGAYRANIEWEYRRNAERYALLRWAQQAFDGFRVVPPGMGICHQVNLEYLARVVQVRDGAAMPDTLLGTDSHTTMVNGLSVLGWGVGGIEAEAAMLGEPMALPWPVVVGVRMTGALPAGATATDLVLTLTEMLRAHGVVGKFVEFFGAGLSSLDVPDRATLSNMCPEYGATAALFPADHRTLRYLRATGRPDAADLAERYTKEQGLFRTDADPEPVFDEVLDLDLSSVEPSMAGPKRPQDRVALPKVWASVVEAFRDRLEEEQPDPKEIQRLEEESDPPEPAVDPQEPVDPNDDEARAKLNHVVLRHGSVVIAAITSCTNTSNPSVMVAAGLLAKKAVEAGLQAKPWVKTSLAPGSRVVTDYLERAGLTPYLDKLGFSLVGFGCTTCIGNSGPLPNQVAQAVREKDLAVVAVLSGNRNFEGRIHPQVRASYLASPPLCVAYALAGRIDLDLTSEPLGEGSDGNLVYLRDVWPSADEVEGLIRESVSPEQFEREYARIFDGDDHWQGAPRADRADLRLGPGLHVHPRAAVLRESERDRGRRGHRGGSGAGPAGGLRDHRPHLSCGLDRAGLARRAVPDRAWGAAPRLQQLRVAPREPRGDAAGDVRQHPPPEPTGARDGGTVDRAPPGRRADDDLRRRHAIQGGSGSARGHRRQGVRLGQLTGLGGEGYVAPGDPRGDRGELRTDPPEQPGGDGRAAAAAPPGRLGRLPRHHRR